MTGLFETELGAFVRIADIVDILPPRHDAEGNPTWAVRLKDRDSVRLHEYSINQLLKRPVTMVAADRGTSVCRVDTSGDDPQNWGVYRTPVIAWATCLDGRVRPVCPEGVHDPDADGFLTTGYVEMHDGSIRSMSDGCEYGSFPGAGAMLIQLLKDHGRTIPDDYQAFVE